MPICNVSANAILNNLFSGTKYLALFNGDPTVEGLFMQEMTGDGYVRKVVNFAAASNRSTSNSTAVWWAELPDTAIRYVGVCSAISGGSIVAYKEVSAGGIIVPEGQKWVIQIGDLAFSLT